MALILCADHELNASSFTARCVASTGASLRAAIVGGLAALTGGRHGGTTARVEALWDEVGETEVALKLRQRLARGEDLPGFGHHLYPDGDVRASALLTRILPHHAAWQELVDEVSTLMAPPVHRLRAGCLAPAFAASARRGFWFIRPGALHGLDRPCFGATRKPQLDPAARRLCRAAARVTGACAAKVFDSG